jgi:hypothetical protein
MIAVSGKKFCRSKCCATLMASKITGSEFMQKTETQSQQLYSGIRFSVQVNSVICVLSPGMGPMAA